MIDKIKKEFKTSEKGITMVSLVVMIIILIILALITIGTITGRLGIIDISTEVAGTYGTEQNRSRLEALVEDTILKYDIVGETLTTEKLAEEIEKEDWIKKAEVRKDEDGNPNDILVETEDGDNFQVEYDEETGEKHIHELGKSDGESFPRVEAEYERESTSIKAKAYDEDTGIEKIEIIYGGEVVGTQQGDTAEFKVSKSGTYTVKATANSGKVAYTTVRVSMKLRAPTIRITSQGKIQNGWYGGDGIPVEVTISTEDKTVTEVHYMLRGVTQQDDTSVAGQEATVTITNPGRTIITGYTKDGAGNESEYVTQDVKYDNVKPRIDKIEAEGEKGNNDWFISDVIVSAEKAEDANSGVAGYYYFVPTEEDIKSNKIPSIEEMTYVSGQDRKMTVRRNGRTTILLVIEDKAGNKSDVKTVAVKKDNEPPRDFQALYTNVGPYSFDITAATTDEHSSVVNYNFFVNLNGKDIPKGSSPDGNGTIEELEPKQTYIVYVEAEDEAGNKRISTNMQVTTKGEVLPPTIELACSYEETNGWYRGDVDVTIRDSLAEENSDLTSITYRVEGANELAQITTPRKEVTFKVTEEGISNVIAFGTGTGGNITEEREKEIKIDKTAPAVPTITLDPSSPNGSNGWYKEGDITATISAEGKDALSGAWQIEYTVGKNTYTTEAGIITQEVLVNTDGITTIKAKTIDKAGNKSTKEATETINRDVTPPRTASLSVTEYDDTTITVQATGADVTSGIASYQFQYKLSSEVAWNPHGDIVSTDAGSQTHVYTDLQEGAEYDLRVIVTDKAGTPKAGASITQKIGAPTIPELSGMDWFITGKKEPASESKKVADYYAKNQPNGTLIIYPKNGIGATLTYSQYPSWHDYESWRKAIKSVYVAPGITALTCENLFYGLTNCTKIDLTGLDTSQVTSMKSMFSGCTSLNKVDLSVLNTENVTTMEGMFYQCGLTDIDLDGFNTSKVTTMKNMFRQCYNLITVDLSVLDTSAVQTVNGMFARCESLTSVNLTGLDFHSVVDMADMFCYCLSLSDLDTACFSKTSATNLYNMFRACESLVRLDLGGFDTSHNPSMTSMVQDCDKLNASMTITSVPADYDYIFSYCSLASNNALFTLNYADGLKSVAQDMVNTKSDNANVQLGELKEQ